MATIPIDDKIDADLRHLRVRPLANVERQVPDEWITLLDQLPDNLDQAQVPTR